MLLRCHNLVRRFPVAHGPVLTVLDGVTLELQAGQSLAIMGPSGCGKSTLLNVIGALDTPDEGSVELDGRDLARLTDHERTRLRAETIGFVFQLHHLLPQLTVRENILVPALALGSSTSQATAERAADLIERVGLAERADQRPGQLSGGERQRVALARALINKPALLLADEPTGALDVSTAAAVVALLTALQAQEGFGLVVVTHAAEVADSLERTVRLRAGRLETAAIAS
ncbi:MAG: ABC transporter ATP-binding protein [Opitutales bacterium]